MRKCYVDQPSLNRNFGSKTTPSGLPYRRYPLDLPPFRLFRWQFDDIITNAERVGRLGVIVRRSDASQRLGAVGLIFDARLYNLIYIEKVYFLLYIEIVQIVSKVAENITF